MDQKSQRGAVGVSPSRVDGKMTAKPRLETMRGSFAVISPSLLDGTKLCESMNHFEFRRQPSGEREIERKRDYVPLRGFEFDGETPAQKRGMCDSLTGSARPVRAAVATKKHADCVAVFSRSSEANHTPIEDFKGDPGSAKYSAIRNSSISLAWNAARGRGPSRAPGGIAGGPHCPGSRPILESSHSNPGESTGRSGVRLTLDQVHAVREQQ